MNQALEIAIRAEEQAKFANKRLDTVNGSIDAIRVTLEGARRESKEQFDSIMQRLAHNDGVKEGASTTKSSFLESRWRVITVSVALATGSLGVAVITYLLRRHTG